MVPHDENDAGRPFRSWRRRHLRPELLFDLSQYHCARAKAPMTAQRQNILRCTYFLRVGVEAKVTVGFQLLPGSPHRFVAGGLTIFLLR